MNTRDRRFTGMLEVRIDDDTLEDVKKIKASYGFKNQSEAVRFAIADTAGRKMPDPALRHQVMELGQEIHKIGININQIARKANSTGFLSAQEKMVLRTYQKELNRKMKEVVALWQSQNKCT